MFYDTTSEPPKYGSLREAVCLVIWKARQNLMIASVRATAQASLGGEAALDAFKEFQNSVHRVEHQEREDRMRQRLSAMEKLPAISFTPIVAEGKRSAPAAATPEQSQQHARALMQAMHTTPKKGIR